ncbi:MAG: helix-turn-helix domain-containing protein [Candidatus Tyrphobacter sp.]
MVILDGSKIGRLRAARAWSQEFLAQRTRDIDEAKSGVSARVIWDAENSKPVSPRTHLLLARAFEVRPWALLPLADRARRVGIVAGPTAAVLLVAGLLAFGEVRMHRASAAGSWRAPLAVSAPLFDDMRAVRVLDRSVTLRHDLLCSSLSIAPGVVLDTDGHNIFCTGAFVNHGEILTGESGYGNFPASYGGSGGRACAFKHRSGGATLGVVGRPPNLSGVLLRHWYANGIFAKLAGAPGGGVTSNSPVGGEGANGVYVQANRIDAGRIRAQGTSGEAGGGGGAIVLAYGSGGLRSGHYLVGGGSGAASCGASAHGARGLVIAYAYGTRQPIDPVAAASFVAGVWRTSPTAITSVSVVGRGAERTLIVHGYGFGRAPFARPFNGVLPDFNVAHPANGRWEAGYTGDSATLLYESWSDRRIVASGLDAGPGDCIIVRVWNAATGAGAAWGGNVPPVPPRVPHIDYVRVTAEGEMTVVGDHLGAPPEPVPFANNDYLAFFLDLAYHPRLGDGPSVEFSVGDKWSDTKLLYEYWSSTRIEIAGFTGAPLPAGTFIAPGDPVALVVWNPQRREATAWGGFAR